jgi:TatD DNase family protein
VTLIDTHAHLDEDAFDPDRGDVLARAAEAGLAAVLTIGTTLASSRRAVALAADDPLLRPVVGVQPNYVAEAAAGDWDEIVRLAGTAPVVGIGETGLDRYWDHAPLALQVEWFERHLDLAARLDLPFVVHCRDAEQDVVDVLRRAAATRTLRGVMHSFTGSEETARACLDLGLHLSFAGMVTFRRNDALRAVARIVPDDRLLVETDAPYLAPQSRRGKRNEPAWVAETAACLAGVRGTTPEALAETTTRNARTLFRI